MNYNLVIFKIPQLTRRHIGWPRMASSYFQKLLDWLCKSVNKTCILDRIDRWQVIARNITNYHPFRYKISMFPSVVEFIYVKTDYGFCLRSQNQGFEVYTTTLKCAFNTRWTEIGWKVEAGQHSKETPLTLPNSTAGPILMHFYQNFARWIFVVCLGAKLKYCWNIRSQECLLCK